MDRRNGGDVFTDSLVMQSNTCLFCSTESILLEIISLSRILHSPNHFTKTKYQSILLEKPTSFYKTIEDVVQKG